MVWTYASPAPAARHNAGMNGVWVDYSTYRNVSQTVQMRLTDVTPDHGYVFDFCQFQVQLVSSDGSVWGSGTLNKTWGVTPGFTTLVSGLPGRSVRLRVKGSLSGNIPGFGTGAMAGNWTSEMRWGLP